MRAYWLSAVLGAMILAIAATANPDSVKIGSVDTAWNLVKSHTVQVDRFDDPKVTNVSCYVSHAKKGGVGGALGVATDPARMGITCQATGPVEIVEDIDKTEKGELVFSEKTSFLFKTMRVTRFYDEKKNTLVYLVWSTKLIDGSPYNNVSAIALKP